jgi:hypothetical protein
MRQVVGMGFVVAHPDYLSEGWGCCNTGITWMSTSVEMQPRSPSPLAPAVTNLELKENLLGHLDRNSVLFLPQTAIGEVLSTPLLPSKSSTAALLRRLPGGMRASAVVWFAAPLDQKALDVFMRHQGASFNVGPILLLPPTGRLILPSGPRHFRLS